MARRTQKAETVKPDRTVRNEIKKSAAMVELVDTHDSKSCGSNPMRVRVSPAAQIKNFLLEGNFLEAKINGFHFLFV